MLSRSEWIQPRNVFGSGFELFRVEGEEEDDGALLLVLVFVLLPETEGDDLGDDDGWPCCAEVGVSAAPADLRIFWRCFMASLRLINDALKEETLSGSRTTELMNGERCLYSVA